MTDTVKATNFIIDHLPIDEGVLSNAEGGGGGLFHGILSRYLVKPINDPVLDSANYNKFRNYITHCVTAMAEQGVGQKIVLYSGRWRKAPTDDEGVGLTLHLTSCMLTEAMYVLKHRQGE